MSDQTATFSCCCGLSGTLTLRKASHRKSGVSDEQYDMLKWQMWNWGHFPSWKHEQTLGVSVKIWMSVQQADSWVMKWCIHRPKHNCCSLCVRPLSQLGGWFTKPLELLGNWCMLLSSAAHNTIPPVKTYLQLLWHAVSCFMVCPFGANKKM